ncbi:DUF5082 domain-containing protein [Stieleria sp. ICT_E10.1]|uniref:DUF5082 domain-containing protein n=1 Tax=Stieleria sedimenti TaxID=2976331 RepID=UPI0021806758|nr:DUF5082 domain-containing protein [Stieleria sedimenti]MCS7468282.1 DUF5082 domain-containing protein [Stieleria sedimenti]
MRKFMLLAVFTLSVSVGDPITVAGEDDVRRLQQEITRLKSEIDSLRRDRDALQSALDQLKKDVSSKSKVDPSSAEDGTLLGVLWEIDVLKPNGTVHATHKFYAAYGKVYYDWREAGNYVERGSRVRVDITKSVDERYIGVYELERLSQSPLVYVGRGKNKRGENPRLRLRVIEN